MQDSEKGRDNLSSKIATLELKQRALVKDVDFGWKCFKYKRPI